MDIIRFNTVVGDDQIIRAPPDVLLPTGPLEVTVVQRAEEANIHDVAATRTWLLAIADEAEKQSPDLPCDLAERHDTYAHGKPLE